MEAHNRFDSNARSIFRENGIIGVDKVEFSTRNIIVGENGSGKTRFLRTVEQIIKNKKGESELLLTMYFPNVSSTVPQTGSKVRSVEPTLYVFDLLKENDEADNCDFLNFMEEASDTCKFINTLFDYTKIGTPKEIRKYTQIIESFNLKFRTLTNRVFYQQNEQVWVRKFTGEETTRDVQLEKAFSAQEISPGELMLFYFSILLSYLEVIKNKKLILVIDEPEQHLHPLKQIALINILNGSSVISQLWIATHSVFLIPYFSFDQVILLDNGKFVPRNSNLYLNTIEKLIGCDNLDALEFITSLNVWQYNHFILECFFQPNVIQQAKKGDEQVTAVINVIRSIVNMHPLKVLDFGAGKTRFWECFKIEFPDIETRRRLIRYRAYEPYPDKNFVYDSAIAVYQNFDEIHRKSYKDNIVLMLNVLHEIPVQEWVNTFRKIALGMTEDGYLILIETKILSVGEQPNNENGFLLLSNSEIKVLFKNAIKVGDDANSKSNLWIIPRIDLVNIDIEKVYQTIIKLNKSTENILRKEFLTKLQTSTSSIVKHEKVRSYAFYSQQFINSKFALEILEDEISKPARNPTPPQGPK